MSEAPLELCRVEHIGLARELLEEGVSTNPLDQSLSLLENGVETEEESFGEALFSILGKAFGMDRAARVALLNVAKRLELEDLLSNLRTAAQKGDWNSFGRNLSQFIRRLFGRAGLSSLAQALDSAAYRRLLIAISARVVPFIGWAIFFVSLGIAIYNNRERLFPQ